MAAHQIKVTIESFNFRSKLVSGGWFRTGRNPGSSPPDGMHCRYRALMKQTFFPKNSNTAAIVHAGTELPAWEVYIEQLGQHYPVSLLRHPPEVYTGKEGIHSEGYGPVYTGPACSAMVNKFYELGYDAGELVEVIVLVALPLGIMWMNPERVEEELVKGVENGTATRWFFFRYSDGEKWSIRVNPDSSEE